MKTLPIQEFTEPFSSVSLNNSLSSCEFTKTHHVLWQKGKVHCFNKLKGVKNQRNTLSTGVDKNRGLMRKWISFSVIELFVLNSEMEQHDWLHQGRWARYWISSHPRSLQSSLSYALEKLFVSRNRQCPQTNIRTYFRAKSRLLFEYFLS